MSFLDARTVDAKALDTDVCVVGAGAAGITLALELGRTGREVCLVEGGDLTPDEATQELHELECVGQPVREDFMARARTFGGTCNLWAGRSMRLQTDDWPLDGQSLDADLEAAAQLLGLPDPSTVTPAAIDARLSPDEARLFEDAPFQPTVSLWAPRPMRFGPRRRGALKRAKNIRVLLCANATRLELEPERGSVRALHTSTLAGGALEVRARHYVLACGGIENARLLLASGVAREHDQVGRFFMDHPRALYGHVRLDQPWRLPNLLGVPLCDGKLQVGVGLDAETRRREGLLNHYVTFEAQHSAYTEKTYGSFVRLMKILLRMGWAGSRTDVGTQKLGNVRNTIYLLTPRELIPHPLYRALWSAKRVLRPRAAARERIVVYFCEQPPNAESRVRLSERRDALGFPRAVLDWRLGAQVTDTVTRLQEILSEQLAARGIGQLTPAEGQPEYTDASHHMGTTRMGRDPRQSVVDPDCRVHGLANLWMAGSSVFPSAGHANPTWTLVALALRLARRIPS